MDVDILVCVNVLWSVLLDFKHGQLQRIELLPPWRENIQLCCKSRLLGIKISEIDADLES